MMKGHFMKFFNEEKENFLILSNCVKLSLIIKNRINMQPLKYGYLNLKLSYINDKKKISFPKGTGHTGWPYLALFCLRISLPFGQGWLAFPGHPEAWVDN